MTTANIVQNDKGTFQKVYAELIDDSGNVIDSTNPLPVNSGSSYKYNDYATDGTYEYYGYSDEGGAWQIKRLTIADDTMRYADGTSDYSTAWTNRASQSYGY